MPSQESASCSWCDSTVKIERGNLYLAGQDINAVADVVAEASIRQGHFSQGCVANRATRDGMDHHMTLISGKEIRDIVNKIISGSEDTAQIRNMLDPLDTDITETNVQQVSKRDLRKHSRERLVNFCNSFLNDRTTRSQDWFVLGLGRQDEAETGSEDQNACFFLVCLYPRAVALRKKLGLQPKDFHITLGYNRRDIHDCSKGVRSLIRPQPHSLEKTPLRIISTPMELVEKAKIAILNGNARRYFHGAALLNAAESIISLQQFQRDTGISQFALPILCILGNRPHERRMILDILELRCRLLGNKRDFEGVIEHANIWIDVLEKINDLGETTNNQLESAPLGYKGVALYMRKEYSKAYPCLVKSHEFFQQAKDRGERTTGLAVSVEKVLAKCCKSLRREAPLPLLIPFPRTAHLFDTGGSAVSSDDWVLSSKSSFFRYLMEGAQVIVEEKIDGANLGFSLSSTFDVLAQNRSHYVTEADHSQFGPLSSWIDTHRESLRKILSSPTDFEERAASQGLILYGEWCVAKHSIKYNKLPGYFIAFDLYDRLEQKFYSRKRFHEILQGSGIPCAPVIATRPFGPYPKSAFHNFQMNGMKKPNAFASDMRQLLDTKSRFASDGGFVEGVVLRIEDNDSEWLEDRVKVVRPDFVQGIQTHWTHGKVEKQILDLEFAWRYCSISSNSSEETGFPSETIDPRAKKMVGSKVAGNDDAVILPRNFSFLWKGEVALSSAPTSIEQIQAWKEHFRTSLVITLTEEQPLPTSWFQEVESCTNLFVPVSNYHAPSLEQTNQMVEAIEDTIKAGGSVVVHCGGGKGRAGTVGACLLLKYGRLGVRASVCGGPMKTPQSFEDMKSIHFNSAAAIEFLRTTRPGSIETKAQEAFVRQFSDSLWKKVILPDFNSIESTKRLENGSRELPRLEARNATNPTVSTKTVKKAKERELREIQRLQRKAPRCIICMGLPGSGKSTFANSLAESYPPTNSWLVINQDKLGRKECQRLAKSCKTKRVVLDRCNLQASEREYWLEQLNSPPKGEVALVYFAADAETCSARVEAREHHETIPMGRGRNIVAAMNEKLEPPTRAEAKRYSSIRTVHTYRDAEEVLRSLGARSFCDTPTETSKS